MPTEGEVRKASENFYAAINQMANGRKGAMADARSHGTTVTAMHPVGGRTTGWADVRDSFDQVAEMASEGKIGVKDQVFQVIGDMAYELGIEHGEFKMAGHHVSLDHRVTNIYKREAEGWKLVHHHADPSPGILDVLSHLQPSPA